MAGDAVGTWGEGTEDEFALVTEGEVRELVVDDQVGTVMVVGQRTAEGALHTRRGHKLGLSTPAFVRVGAITGGVTTAFTFTDGAIPADALRIGMQVNVVDVDAPDDYGVVNGITRDVLGQAIGLTVAAAFASDHAAPVVLHWDPVMDSTHGHRIGSSYRAPQYLGDPRAGHRLHLKPHGGADLMLHPSGQLSIGAKRVISDMGLAEGVHPKSLDGSEYSHGLERHGAVVFDQAERGSATQAVDIWNNGVHSTMGPGSAGFLGGASSIYQASWLTATDDGSNTPAQGDYLLQLTAMGTDSAVRWRDTALLDEDAHARGWTVDKDVSISIPVLCSPTSGEDAGSAAQLVADAPVGSSVLVPDFPVTALGTVAADVWTVEPGTAVAEQVTVDHLDTAANHIVLVGTLAHDHQPGALIQLYKALGGTQTLHSGGSWDGAGYFDDVTADVTSVAIGLYDGTTWHRGHWGDPAWQAPDGVVSKWLGPLSVQSGKWTSLRVKATELLGGIVGVAGRTIPGARQTIVGTELLVHGASGNHTVYFDAVHVGHTAHRDRLAAGSIRSHHHGVSSVKARHLNRVYVFTIKASASVQPLSPAVSNSAGGPAIIVAFGQIFGLVSGTMTADQINASWPQGWEMAVNQAGTGTPPDDSSGTRIWHPVHGGAAVVHDAGTTASFSFLPPGIIWQYDTGGTVGLARAGLLISAIHPPKTVDPVFYVDGQGVAYAAPPAVGTNSAGGIALDVYIRWHGLMTG